MCGFFLKCAATSCHGYLKVDSKGAKKKKAALWRPLNIVVMAGLEPALRFSISIMPALPVSRLMHYSTHLTRKRELSYITTERALASIVTTRTKLSHLRYSGNADCRLPNALTCCAETKKPRRLTEALFGHWWHLSACPTYIHPVACCITALSSLCFPSIAAMCQVYCPLSLAIRAIKQLMQ